MARRLALVTGATGAVGPVVVRAIHSAGYAVRTLSRHVPPPAMLPADTDVRIGDVCDASAVDSAVKDADLVVHLAALLHQFDNAAGGAREYERVNIAGTENVARAAESAGVRRLIALSSIAVYGPTTAGLIDERATPRPDTDYGRTKLAAERVVLSVRASGRPIGSVLRAAAVYGPHLKGNYRRLAIAIARGRYVQLGPGLNRRTIVHDRDLAGAIVLAAEHADAAGAVFNVTDGQVHTLAEIVAAIHQVLGKRPSHLQLPLLGANTTIALAEHAFRLMGLRPPVTRQLLDKYREDVAVDGSLIQRTLGFRPIVDLQAGWRETMDALRQAGLTS